ncbi:FtsQ-type POTRA domain-containing protein [Pelagicoccus sp. SDUM812003]|uniref:cell division protein FtsQ/DivIB n=1 Tax=Pelagicoccus sp. SDUM812003 TaxID=3041267 RepID=UPI00280C6F0A|nr:FtsQ-type POTRA domain-containing protein [Pelagicoccus sp. SDUM812003]MDQ8204416.1 FtsQ-type POTRA domain-containing protein [Pelagicoccus sp. SDUM812003]
MSSASERRIWIGRLKTFGLLVSIVGVVVAALQLASFVEAGPELLTKAGESLPIRSIAIETDGSLERDWLTERLEIPENENLLSVDLSALKAKLESVGQIENAEVERLFPDTLIVTVKERQPIARLLAQRANGERMLLFVDESGHVFEAERMDKSLVNSLPFLDGVALRREGSAFSRIENIAPLASLLQEARAIAPHIYKRWRIVSLEKQDRLIARGKAAKEVVFDTRQDFRDQLGKLDYILDHYRSARTGIIDHVDLTLGDQVPVRSL